jgi:PAP2 superfamily
MQPEIAGGSRFRPVTAPARPATALATTVPPAAFRAATTTKPQAGTRTWTASPASARQPAAPGRVSLAATAPAPARPGLARVPARPATAIGPPLAPAPAHVTGRPGRWQHPVAALAARHGSLRYLQIVPVAVLLWAMDAADRFRGGAALAGLRNARVVNAISSQLGDSFARPMNAWLAAHPIAGSAAAWYYMMLQGAVTAIVGLVLIWRRAPSFGVHRNALLACNLVGLIAFWLYPVAPPRMLRGYHDITASMVPFFSRMVEGKAADQFAATPSLHVAWAIWVAVAVSAVVRKPVLQALVWLYPVATIIDVIATANHYWLDVLTAPGVVLLGYGIALIPALGRRLGWWRRPPRRRAVT